LKWQIIILCLYKQKEIIPMSDPKDAKNTGKNLNAARAQKLREQLANKVSELSDEELERVSGGTSTDIIISTVLVSSAGCITYPSSPSPTAVSCD
jgi:hypothetical protein